MAHIKITETRGQMTPVEWLPVGAQIGELVNTWAGRTDLVTYVGPGAGGPAPACYNPATAEIEVNVDTAFGAGISPETIGDLRKRDTLFDWTRAAGAIFHEALHARYSRYDIKHAMTSLSKNEFESFMSLEESRIEKHGADNYPGNRVFLRACALDIVIHDLKTEEVKNAGVRSVAKLAALTCARVDSGSIQAYDIEEVTNIVTDFFGKDTYNKMRDIWLRFQEHDNHINPLPLYDLAREWDKLISEVAEERGESEGSIPQDILDAVASVLGDIADALGEAAENIEIEVADEVQDQQRDEEWKEVAAQRNQQATQARDHKEVANKVFAKSTGDLDGVATSSRLVNVRAPEATERAAAVKISHLLEKAKYRERDEKEIKSILPPGRLRTRAVVQNAAYKAQGSMVRAEAWDRTVRRHTDDPTLAVGVMVDISGSMSAAMNPMAVTAWAMSEATRRVQGRCAMVYYGQDVFPTLKPGQHLDQVNVYTAADGTEKFDKAFKALDGSLNLLYGTGARLLVVVSDGCYTETERDKAKQWLRECDANGVAVVWLPFDSSASHYRSRDAERLTEGTGAVLLSDVTDPASAALTIGKAAADALSRIGQRNAA